MNLIKKIITKLNNKNISNEKFENIQKERNLFRGQKKLLEKEKELGSDIKFEDIMDEVAGVYPKVMLDGEMEAGAWSCGMVVGLINDIPSCKELIDGIMSEADSLITKRLEGMLSA